ncbi:hypothetical protein [Argonema galeatum]|uniref:hypothetical protein n=1 Tax=Argonema galeatum TaxID=2942762 RepID=UPI002012D00A|nr:hypothetical protein [Argonema galeatum A003/A1]
MRSDIQGLEITKGELRHLSGVDPDDVFRSSMLRESGKQLTFLFNELLIALALTPIIVGALYTFIIRPIRGASINWAILLLIIVPISVIAGRWFWLRSNSPKLLVNLLDDVDRYHAVLQAIDISDRLETAGSSGGALTDRTQVIAALQLTREDLIRALMSERILRENKNLIAANPELFTNNLRALEAMQVNTQAGEYGRLLNEALQIGLSVQEEMRKLQHQRSR